MDYLLPDHLSREKLRTQMEAFAPCVTEPSRRRRLRFFDSFDWRLYQRGLLLEEESDNDTIRLTLRRLATAAHLAWAAVPAPGFATELPPCALRETLTDILERRRLLPLAEAIVSSHPLAVLNKREKTVARLIVDDALVGAAGREPSERLATRLRLLPVRGHANAGTNLRRYLSDTLALNPAPMEFWRAAMHAAGNRPGEYATKPNFRFPPALPTREAIRRILSQLLDTMERHLEGTRQDLDSEFLHDFRVAVRRTRAVLGQFGDLLPASAVGRFRGEFAWLGALTGPTRDLDVHLLRFDVYSAGLPPDQRRHLEPLRERLGARRRTVQSRMADELDASRCRLLRDTWRAWLEAPSSPEEAWPAAAEAPVFATSAKRIRKVLRRALREGAAIDDQSPAEDLHELRKTCKKLRYLLEFFQSLHPPDKMAAIIKSLKELQENLGEFQDLEVHIQSLRDLGLTSAEPCPLPPATLLAMGQTIERLRERQQRCRAAFAERFAVFASSVNLRRFRSLFRKNSPQP